MCAALPFFLTFVFAELLVTRHIHPIALILLSVMSLPPGLEQPFVFLISLMLLLSSLAANTAMTSMANKTIRGEVLSVRDLFRYRGFGVTSLALVTGVLATVLGSLVFFVGALVATGLMLATQSMALRTGNIRLSLRASMSILRTDPLRTLCLAALVLLGVAIGFVTGGLGLLAAIPVAKITGALADGYVESHGACVPLSGVSLLHSADLMPQAVQFHWTADEQAMLRQTAPLPHLPHLLTALVVTGIAAFLLFPRISASTSDLSASEEPVQPAAVTQVAPAPLAPPIVPTQVDSLPVPSSASVPDTVFVDSYGADNDPPLPCQLHWGNYTARIEQIGSEDGPDGKQQRLTVVDAAGSAVYTVSNEWISSVKLERLLGDEQSELLVHTSEGGDGKTCIDLALTQQGGVHDVYLLHDKNMVTPLHVGNEANEEIVVDAPLDGPSLDIHHYPTLTSTYRWNGREFENAIKYSPRPTQDRISQYEQILTAPANAGDDWATSMKTAAVGLRANASLLGQSRLPMSVVSTQGYQLGTLWVRENAQSTNHIVEQIAEAKRPLPKVDSNAVTDQSGIPNQPSQP